MEGRKAFFEGQTAVEARSGGAGISRLLWMFLALMLAIAAAVAIIGTAGAADSRENEEAVPLERAHAHNDYEHERPLHDALGHGFKSVEADVWLVDGELLVAHDRALVQPERTLESLYLEPLRREIKANGGSAHEGDPDYFTLLVDIKSEDVATYQALHEELQKYRRMMTTFEAGRVKNGAVTAIVSGNRPRAYMEAQRVRYAAYDGRLSDLGSATDQGFVPLISDNWTKNFTWQGVGPMPEAEREKLHDIVDTAHANGQRVRFYATPEVPVAREAVWRELLAAEADYINTDHLAELESFLLANDPHPTDPHVYWNGSTGGGR